MEGQIDYASPDQQPARRAVRFRLFVPFAALAVFLLSLAVWSRGGSSWASHDFRIEVEQIAWGLPRWLILNRMRTTGAAPPFDPAYLPESADFRPGLHVDAPMLCLSLVGCLVAGVVLYPVARLLTLRRVSGTGPAGATRGGAWWWTLGLASGSGAVIAVLSRNATGVPLLLLVFVLLPLVVCIAGFRVRSIRGAVFIAGAAGLSFWWSHRMVLLGRGGRGHIGLDDVLAVAIGILFLALAAAVSASFGQGRGAVRRVA